MDVSLIEPTLALFMVSRFSIVLVGGPFFPGLPIWLHLQCLFIPIYLITTMPAFFPSRVHEFSYNVEC